MPPCPTCRTGVIATALDALTLGWGQQHHPGLGGMGQLVRDQEILGDGWGEEVVEAAEAAGGAALAAGGALGGAGGLNRCAASAGVEGYGTCRIRLAGVA